jgi:DNA replication protein DnaC
LADFVEALVSIQAKPSARVMVSDAERRGRAAVAWAKQRLSDGRYRDELQAERPAGCWCLGEGGRIRRYVSPDTYEFEDYCDCQDGQRVKCEVETEMERLRAERIQRRLLRLFVEAQVPGRFGPVSFDTFPVSEQTRAALDAIRYWSAPPEGLTDDEADAWYAARKHSLFLYGQFGTGKTGLAVSAMRLWIDHSRDPALFLTVPNLLDRIRETYGPHASGTEAEVIDTVKTVPLLVLDDMGAERVTDWVAEKLFTIINHRHDEDLETIFTSNLSIQELAGHIGERTVWRIVEMCEVVKVDGPNLRDHR